MTQLPIRSKRGVVLFLALAWFIWAIVQGVAGYVKNGPDGAHDQLIEFLLMHLVLVPILIALYAAGKLEQRLKPSFPVGASFMAITLALVVSVPLGFYLLITVSRHFFG